MLEKHFDPARAEQRIYEDWEKRGAFKPSGNPEAEAYSIVIPPPNVTGSLHMGHALNNTIQDIMVRFERMRGKDVLWQPGTDHAGIATQMVVERKLAAQGEPSRWELGREEFVRRVWEWKEESGSTIINQLRRLGASCDWSRERFTMDEGLSRAVRKVFVELYREGLIYKDKRLVNWDPKLHTAISDLEVVPTETKGHLWHFRYPVEGEEGRYIVVATTRPETMLGDTAVAVHPDDERYKDIIGKRVILPLVGRKIPIVADEHADPETGTGAVKITPAHDFDDFEVGKRHGLPMINILAADATLLLRDNADFLQGLEKTDELEQTLGLHGVERFEARARIVARMDGLGLVEKIEDHVHMVPYGDRSGVPVEPWLTDQWYVNAKVLAGPALEAVRKGDTRFIPDNWKKTYFDWLENIQPWCISRQLWWGHQIPAWYGAEWDSDWETYQPAKRKIFVAESEEDAIVQARRYIRDASKKPIDVTVVPLSENDQIHSTYKEEMVGQNNRPIIITGAGRDLPPYKISREEDVLDTWFSSALWPFSTLGWPDETPELKRYYPTSVLVTGFDIIFFWVARMMMMGLHFMKDIPFHDVYIHALVRDEHGAKMSKSKGNVIDPLELVDRYGADALRFTLAAMAVMGRDIKLAESRVAGYRNFGTKLWNAARFLEMNEVGRNPDFDPAACREPLNRWIAGEALRATRAVTEGIEAYKFNEAAAAIYQFTWNVYCDWYLELIKPVLREGDAAAREETRATARWALDTILKLLHPFMPFITEELWQRTGGEGLLMLSAWPSGEGLVDEEAARDLQWVIGAISAIRSTRAEMNVPAGMKIPAVLAGAGAESRRRLAEWKTEIIRLARLSDIELADAAPAKAAQIVHGEAIIALPMEGVIDLAAETARLEKEIARAEKDARGIEARLANEKFLSRAPQQVVEENRQRLEELKARMEKLHAAIERLKALG